MMKVMKMRKWKKEVYTVRCKLNCLGLGRELEDMGRLKKKSRKMYEKNLRHLKRNYWKKNQPKFVGILR